MRLIGFPLQVRKNNMGQNKLTIFSIRGLSTELNIGLCRYGIHEVLPATKTNH